MDEHDEIIELLVNEVARLSREVERLKNQSTSDWEDRMGGQFTRQEIEDSLRESW